MKPMTFRALTVMPVNANDTEKKQIQSENRDKTLENLVKQLPAEATGTYLLGFDLFKNTPALLTYLTGTVLFN